MTPKGGTRYIFVTGGVASSLGKGLATASLGALLQARGYSVRLRKLDPYLNVDPGTMNPYEHGEVFVTDDGAETDLDLGHYERFTGRAAERSDNITAGRIYREIIEAERRGDFLGATVQVVPHVTEAIKRFVLDADGTCDFVLCEIGGTVGDIESLPFLEAIRQLAYQSDSGRCAFVHLTLVPYLSAAGEIKTKPTQHSVKELRSIGLQPDILICRCQASLRPSDSRKIALLCNVREEAIIPSYDVDNIYDAPLEYHRAGLDAQALKAFGLDVDAMPRPSLASWESVSAALRNPQGGGVDIAVIGKYTGLPDAYKSLREALVHGGIANNVRVRVHWLDAEASAELIEPNGSVSEDRIAAAESLRRMHGIIVPGGFGSRGAEGKIGVAGYARTHGVPYFGICFGMQMAVVEAARNLAGVSGATSSEFRDDGEHVVGLMTEWRDQGGNGNGIARPDPNGRMGGTMRLGAYDALLAEGSKIREIYDGQERVSERHRHRYEINAAYEDALARVGMRVSGRSPDGLLPETIEIPDHPWFIGVQYHPELKSRPFDPHPLFASFVKAAIDRSRLL